MFCQSKNRWSQIKIRDHRSILDHKLKSLTEIKRAKHNASRKDWIVRRLLREAYKGRRKDEGSPKYELWLVVQASRCRTYASRVQNENWDVWVLSCIIWTLKTRRVGWKKKIKCQIFRGSSIHFSQIIARCIQFVWEPRLVKLRLWRMPKC